MLLVKLFKASALFNLSKELDTNVLDVHKIQRTGSGVLQVKNKVNGISLELPKSIFMISGRCTINHPLKIFIHTHARGFQT